MNILGVTLSSNLAFEEHLNEILSKPHNSCTLKSHGLTGSALHEFTKATGMTQVMYASPAWWGYTKGKDKLEGTVRRLKRMNFLPIVKTMS